MKTCGEFLEVIRQTGIHELKFLLEEWQQDTNPEDWAAAAQLPLTYERALDLRNNISNLFAGRISRICTEALYDCITKAHVLSIEEFNIKAAEEGFIITEKRKCVSFTEAFKDEGIINVTSDGLSLTPKGESIAEEVRREIEGEG